MDPKTLERKTRQTKNGLRCKKHPGYVAKTPPKPTTAYPAGCPVCVELWEFFLKEAPEPEIVVPDLLSDDNGNGDESTEFKPGPENPKWKEKVDKDDPIHEMIRKYTRGGEAIVAEVCKIAGVHPRPASNLKGVAYRDKIQALKWLTDRGWGPVVDPNAEGSGGIQINILNLGEGTFTDFTRQIQQELKQLPGG